MADKKEQSREVKPSEDLHVKIDVDCSEALKGLKAIQREAKKATQALRELEDVDKSLENAYKSEVDADVESV